MASSGADEAARIAITVAIPTGALVPGARRWSNGMMLS